MQSWPIKDPNEVLDYGFDWARPGRSRLEDGETLTNSVFVVEAGDVVIDSQSYVATGRTTVWLSGGTPGVPNTIRNRVTTSEGRVFDKSAKLRIRSL